MAEDLKRLFSEIMEGNKQKILRICFVYASNKEDQKDLFQEVALNIWKSLPSFRHQSSVDTWVYRVCLNIAIQYAMKRNKTRRSLVDIEGIIIFDERADVETDIENIERIKMLYSCISKLEGTEKALVLLFLEDLSYRSISEVTGISENHVAVKLKRIKLKLFNCVNN
jgi:RNA polymerase sigma factor (sigma-70 family)